MAGVNTFDAVVIGAGANGLVAAIVLARAGKRVMLVDGAHAVGRRTQSREFAPGFSAAPLALDSGWVPKAVIDATGVARTAMRDPEYSISVALEDGGFLALSLDGPAAKAALARHSARDADAWGAVAHRLGKFASVLEHAYALPAPDISTRSFGELFSLAGVARAARALGKADLAEFLRVAPMSVQDYADDMFESAVAKAALGAGGVRDIRQGPRSGGTMFVLLHYLAGAPINSVRNRSWWEAGPDAFVDALAAAARGHGVTIRTSAHVARILVRDNAVTGVVLDDAEEIFAPTVISTADPAQTLLGLVDPVWLDPEFIRAVRNIKFRGATGVVQFALDKLPEIPGLEGTVSLSANLDVVERAYDAAKYGGTSESPHVEITAPSMRWPACAPAGKHVLVARVSFVGGVAATPDLGELATRAIERTAPGFRSTVLHRAALAPADIEREYGLTEGALSHGELTPDQILFMRPVPGWSRHAMPIGGLYLGGAGTHPGPGIVGGAGLLAAREVLKRKA